MAINLNKINSLLTCTNNSKTNAALAKLPSQLAQDSVELSVKQNVVKVFNSMFKKVSGTEKIVSPEFNGCHGVGILSGDEMFFAHFPIYYKSRMIAGIEDGLAQFSSKDKAKVVFISPVSRQGVQDSAFDNYLSLIKNKFGENIQLEMLEYPSRSKGATYKYVGVVNNGEITSSLQKVPNPRRFGVK